MQRWEKQVRVDSVARCVQQLEDHQPRKRPLPQKEDPQDPMGPPESGEPNVRFGSTDIRYRTVTQALMGRAPKVPKVVSRSAREVPKVASQMTSHPAVKTGTPQPPSEGPTDKRQEVVKVVPRVDPKVSKGGATKMKTGTPQPPSEGTNRHGTECREGCPQD